MDGSKEEVRSADYDIRKLTIWYPRRQYRKRREVRGHIISALRGAFGKLSYLLPFSWMKGYEWVFVDRMAWRR